MTRPVRISRWRIVAGNHPARTILMTRRENGLRRVSLFEVGSTRLLERDAAWREAGGGAMSEHPAIEAMRRYVAERPGPDEGFDDWDAECTNCAAVEIDRAATIMAEALDASGALGAPSARDESARGNEAALGLYHASCALLDVFGGVFPDWLEVEAVALDAAAGAWHKAWREAEADRASA